MRLLSLILFFLLNSKIFRQRSEILSIILIIQLQRSFKYNQFINRVNLCLVYLTFQCLILVYQLNHFLNTMIFVIIRQLHLLSQ
jgi:hypothetical protein